MNVIAPLVDTLLALKRPTDVAAPGAVPGTGAVANDVRLPSRAAMQLLLGVDLGVGRESTPAQLASRFGEATTLSVAARAISAILGAGPDDAVGVRGASPVWPSFTTPIPAQLAGALARVVATSGLFYESHLQQFAAGMRPLALLAQEPQARLGALASTHPELLKPAQGDPKTWLNPGAKSATASATATAAAIGVLVDAVSSVDGGEIATAPKAVEQTPASGSQQVVRTDMPEPQAAADGPRPGPAGRVDAAYGAQRVADTVASLGLAVDKRANSERLEEAQGQLPKNQATDSSQARSAEQGSAAIHPEAVSLVRQQLDVLAMSAFRWGGEVWPGTPMQWDIREEHEDARVEAEADDAARRTWSTRLAITLPTLREVEVRLSLAGSTLQVHLAAREAATVALLGEGGSELPKRFGGLGLQLTGLQIGALPVEPASQEVRKDADAS